MDKITPTARSGNETLIRYPVALYPSSGSFGPRIALASLPVIGLACLAAHECSQTSSGGEALIVTLIVLSQIFLIVCLQSQNLFVFSVMLLGLISKIVSASLEMGMARWDSSDALMYFDKGRNLAEGVSSFWGVFSGHSIWGTDLVASLTACLFRLVGTSFVAGSILFTLVAFWGQYLCYLAYCESFSEADRRPAVLALFMWPSIVFWTSFIGKDALMLFFLSLASYSMAKLSGHKTKGMFILLAVAACGSFFIRPHIAVILIISIVSSFYFGSSTFKTSSARRRIINGGLLVCFSAVAVYLCAQFLQLGDLVEAQNHLDVSVQSNQLGGSGFDPGTNLVVRIALAPLLLFRPFPWEINGIPAALTSIEGLLLFALVFYRRTALGTFLKSMQANVFAVFLLWFVSLNLLLLGIGESNFGLLARQRVMILPMILMLLFASITGKRTTSSRR